MRAGWIIGLGKGMGKVGHTRKGIRKGLCFRPGFATHGQKGVFVFERERC